MSPKSIALVSSLLLVTFGIAHVVQQREGYKDTPLLPGQKWRVHDADRPYPAHVTPGVTAGAPPSDAIVLFDGKDLSKFCQFAKGDEKTPALKPAWQVESDGSFHVAGKQGSLYTKQKFGDCQLHVEWREQADIDGQGQGRGNSGVFLMGEYEVQVLESYGSATYADGQAAALYGQWPPLVNPIKKPGEWQTYDIVFHAPRFNGDKVTEPAYMTVFFNGVCVHDHQKLNGPTNHAVVLPYHKQDPEERLVFQDHGPHKPPSYRNIWIRKLGGYS